MKRKLTKSVIILVVLISFFTSQITCLAQDTGKPVLQTVSTYTLAGGGGGMILGFAYWLLDPLAPNADLKGSLLQGYGVGVFLGFVFGILQLNRQAILPYQDEGIQDFQGSILEYEQMDRSILFVEQKKPATEPNMTLFNFQYSF